MPHSRLLFWLMIAPLCVALMLSNNMHIPIWVWIVTGLLAAGFIGLFSTYYAKQKMYAAIWVNLALILLLIGMLFVSNVVIWGRV